MAQEHAVREGGVPSSIIRATQFHALVDRDVRDMAARAIDRAEFERLRAYLRHIARR